VAELRDVNRADRDEQVEAPARDEQAGQPAGERQSSSASVSN
jgi:hypothetical protein